MKLATYRDGSRDGQLVVVSRDLRHAHYASGIAGRLQQVLDDWNFMSPQLEALSQALGHGQARHAFAFEPAQCMAPLPRAYRWVAAWSAVDPAADAALRMSERASDELLGACDAIVCVDEGDGIEVAARAAAVTGDVAVGTPPDAALDSVRLLLFAVDVGLSARGSAEVGDGLGAPNDPAATAFSPVAVTPDELGAAWHGGRIHLEPTLTVNGERAGRPAGAAAAGHFGERIAHLARTRKLRAGSIVGGGVAVRSGGLRIGDRVGVEMTGADATSVFGATDQRVHAPGRPESP